MTANASLIFRADATSSMGTGHVMRCLALAQAALTLGLGVRFVGRVQVPWVAARLAAEGIPLEIPPGPVPSREKPEELLAQLRPGKRDMVILDGYHFGPECQRAVRAGAASLVVIDDYAHLPEYCCDIILNQNIGAESLAYNGEVGEALLGPRYALLRREFLAARAVLEQEGDRPCLEDRAVRILLSLGGGDFSSSLAELAPVFRERCLTGRTLRVIAGAMPERRVREILSGSPASLVVESRVRSMPEALRWADVCVTAGGSTCWELCCLGVPFLTLAVAENQGGIVAGLAGAGLAPRFDAAAFGTFLERRDRGAVRRRLMDFVDGEGCWRVLRRLWPLGAVRVREALPGDSQAVLALVNEDAVRACSLDTHFIGAEEHAAWYASRLLPGKMPFFLALCGGVLAGYVRYDAGEEGECTVSIALAEPWRGLGLGTWLLETTANSLFALGVRRIYAWVKADNIASQRLFTRVGYTLLGPRMDGNRTALLFQRDRDV